MAHEEHTPRCGNNIDGGDGGGAAAGGGRVSKKLKHNKVPQRGMGVAQLEKIILEERQMKDVSVLTLNSTNFRPPSIPLPPPLPPTHHPLISKSDAMNPNFVSKPMKTSSGSGNNWRRLYNFEGQNPNPNPNPYQNQNRNLIAMPTNQGGVPNEPSQPIWSQFPTVTQRSQFQQPCSLSMVNVSLGTTSSSVMNFQIEPPSNQSYYGNEYQSFWPEEDKMVGMKRSYPFSMENMPIPTFHCKFPSYVTPISISDESTSCSNGVTTSLDSHIPGCRENPFSLGSIRDKKTNKFIDENLGLTKDFLTLGPPRSSSPPSNSSSKEKLPTLPPYQGQTEVPSETEWSNKQALCSFFPPSKTSNGEVGEHVDLNLKL